MKHRMFRVAIIFAGAILSVVPALASANPCCNMPPWQPMIGIQAGVSFVTDAAHKQVFPIQNPATDEFYIYEPEHETQTIPTFDVFAGAEWSGLAGWGIQLGFDYTQLSSFSVKGTLTQGADAQSQNSYAYRYRLTLRQLSFVGKFLYKEMGAFQPYLLAGLGTAFNDAKHFSTTVPSTLTFTRMYKNHSTTSLSYVVGAGIDVEITCFARVGVGYRFADLGKIALGAAKVDAVSVQGTLSQSHLYANEVLAQLTVEF